MVKKKKIILQQCISYQRNTFMERCCIMQRLSSWKHTASYGEYEGILQSTADFHHFCHISYLDATAPNWQLCVSYLVCPFNYLFINPG